MTAGTTRRPARSRAALARTVAALCAALAAVLCSAVAAQAAEFGIRPGSFEVVPSTTQAGAHPDVRVAFALNDDGAPDPSPIGVTKQAIVDLPPGLVGDPSATPRCEGWQWPSCPANTQIGTVRVGSVLDGVLAEFDAPVYNLVPSHGNAAEFGFQALVLDVRLLVSVREGDHGLRTVIDTLPAIGPLLYSDLTFWGVPADPVHDPDRGKNCTNGACFGGGRTVSSPPKPFMRNAATCEAPSVARIAVEDYENEGVFMTSEATVPQLTGCGAQDFAATGRAQFDTPVAGAPAGLAVQLAVEQDDDPAGLATPPLKQAVVTLPEGTVVSPSAADGLQSCTDAQFGHADGSAVDCPLTSKIGNVAIDSPLMDEPLVGGVYLGAQVPSQLMRLFMVAERDGVRLKMVGRVDVDPVTGRVTTTFDDQPQLPFRTLTMNLKGGPRAVLSNPRQCGPATTSFALAPYGGGAAATSTDVSAVTESCASGFEPSFAAGSSSTTAGAATAFTLSFARGDRDADLGGLDVTLPAGLIPRIASVPLCAEAQAAAGTCGEESRVGSAQTTAGPGGQPFALPGRVYVGGPYKGAPYSLAIVVPALAGPLDLGTVVVRAAVHVDKRTAALRVVSDPLPTILQGIPLQLRSVKVAIDRPGFMLNPTSCAPRTIGATIASSGGASAGRSVRFQASDCAALPYAPKLAVKVGAQTRANRAVALTATLTQPANQAGNRSVKLTLPDTLNARLSVVNRACTQQAYDAGTCGEAAKIGTASANTPVLKAPLSGPAYFVRNPARKLPDIVVQLRGEVAIDLVGKVTVNRQQRLETAFDTIPDVPISRFELALPATNSPVSTVASLCTKAAKRATAQQSLRGQNGRLVQRKVRLTTQGCAKKPTARRKAAARAKRAGASARDARGAARAAAVARKQ